MNFVVVQVIMATCSVGVSVLSRRSFLRTGDRGLNIISRAFFFFAAHSLLLASSAYLYSLSHSLDLKLGLIVAKLPLYLGLLFLLEIPIIFHNDFIRENYTKIFFFFTVFILVVSFIHYMTPLSPILDGKNGFTVEYIGVSLLAVGVLLVPYTIALLFIYSLWSKLPKTASLFFKSKTTLLCAGMWVMLVGYTLYVVSTNHLQSGLGVLLVLAGDIMIVGAMSLSRIREFMINKSVFKQN